MFLLLDQLGKKSSGTDQVHPFFVIHWSFRNCETHIIKLSLSQGKFLDSLKIAKVDPIFKQGSHLQ